MALLIAAHGAFGRLAEYTVQFQWGAGTRRRVQQMLQHLDLLAPGASIDLSKSHDSVSAFKSAER
ncbi:hypothetical protein [Sphingomonas sp. Leaf32]|uniref:hypothetical protein n=1 Tax=Sphingomonas sp. Leaf32 TaxID=1736214 RepID=UPI001F1D5C2F|nr:hypothetical protein [Sphingomonas sp. Leaf32]